MRIAINTRLLLKGKMDGIGWFTAETARRMVLAHPEHTFFFFFDRKPDKEFIFADSHTEMHRFSFDGLEDVVERLNGKNVYFTLDLDVLDPSVFPGTGTPEAGGVTFDELRKAVTLVCSRLNIVGCDVNELSPVYDQSGVSTAVACKIIREMLLALS